MEFYNLTIKGLAPTTGHKLIIFGDLKENLFAATKFLVDEQLKDINNMITTYGETEDLKKSIEFQNNILPIVKQLYNDDFFNDIFDPNTDTETIDERKTITYQNQSYTIYLEHTDSAVRSRYTAAHSYEDYIDKIVNKIAQVHKKVGVTDA